MRISTTRPDWYKSVAEERRGFWQAGDSRHALRGSQSFYGAQTRIVLKDGTILDGIAGDERNRWDPSKHAVAIRMPGRKSQKWIAVRDILAVWGDKGPKLEDLLTAYIMKGKS